jgi:Right handed beta helix region
MRCSRRTLVAALGPVLAVGILLAAAACGGARKQQAAPPPAAHRHPAAPAASRPRPKLPAGCTRLVRPGDGLSRALNRAAPGSTVCLASGDYAVRSLTIRRSGRAGARITVRSASPSRPATIHGAIFLANSANYWTFEDLRLDSRNPWNLPSPMISGDHSVWRRLDVTNDHAGAGTSGGGICFSLGQTETWGFAADTIIEDSRIHDCGISDNHNHGVYVVATSGWTIIRDNWIYRNGDRGIQLYPDARNVLISHNLIDGNGSGIIFSGRASMTSRDNVVVGNIISNSRNRWNVESWYPDGTPVGIGNVVTHNCLWASNANPEYDARGGVAPAVGFTVAPTNVTQRPTLTNDLALRRLPGKAGCRGFGPTTAPPPE